MTSQTRRPRFAINAVANWIAFLFAAVVGFFLSPYLVEHLGPTRYGVWTLIGGLVGYLGLLDLGIRQAVNRYTARHHAEGNHQESSLIVSAALRLFGILGLLVTLLSVVLAVLAPTLFNIPEALVHEARSIVVLGGITIAVSLIGGVFGGIVTGLERFDIHCGLEIFVTTVRTTAIVVALREGYGLVELAGIQLAASVFNCVVFWVASHRLYRELRISLRGTLGPHVRTILSFSASLTVLFALGKIISYSDSVVIGAFLPIESVTYFAIAGSLCMYAKEIPRSLAYVMTPRISTLTSTESDRIGETILRVARIATLASTPIAVTFLIRGESFIDLWMGPAYGPLSGEVLRILSTVVWLDASRSVVMASLTGMARQSMVIPGVVVEAACNLALSLTLVHHLGIAGVALGTLIPCVVTSLGYIPHCFTKAAGIPASHYLRSALLLPTVACIPFGLATFLVEWFVPAPNMALFFLQTFLMLPLVSVFAWILCLSPPEKAQVKSELRKVLGR